MPVTKVVISGPVFDGTASRACRELTEALAAEIADVGTYMIKMDTQRMTRSGSDTGQAAEGVLLAGSGSRYVISGAMHKGRVWWPWLEGVSKRNQSTPFKGYHSFRRTRLRMRKQAMPYLQPVIDAYAERMGGA